MIKNFQYLIVNEKQNEIMAEYYVKEKYKWEDRFLIKRILSIVPNERDFFNDYSKSITENQKKQNIIVNDINKIVDSYNKNNYFSIHDIRETIINLYSELYKYKEIESYYTRENEMIKALNFSETILITGVGGIGKTIYIFDITQEIRKKNFKHLTIYGKYQEGINYKRIFKEIKQIIKYEKFILIIDALNEFREDYRNYILKFINDYKQEKNLRIILTCRNYSLSKNEIQKITNLVDDSFEFNGVSNEDAVEKISEKYNIDLTIHEHLLSNNNPLVFSIIIKILSKNFLAKNERKPLIKGTHIYEAIVKDLITSNGKKRWEQLKDVVKEICKTKSKTINSEIIHNLLKSESHEFIKDLKNFGLIMTYNNENIDYIVFNNESLIDYLIARTIINDLLNKDSDEIVKIINLYISNFYSINRALILMLFEKYNKHLDKAINIIKNTSLLNELSLDVFNELDLTKVQIEYLRKNLKLKNPIEETILQTGGYHNNPFNFVFYINDILFKNQKIINNFDFQRHNIYLIKTKLVVWIRSIEKYDYSYDYLHEKFYFAFWMSSLPNGNIRFLSRKLIFQIINVDENFINLLIKNYFKVKDEYIKEGIIHILSSQKKDNYEIVHFFKKINTPNLLNINSLHNIRKYLHNNINFLDDKKEELLLIKDNGINTKIFKFFSFVDFTFKYEYRLFNADNFHFSMDKIVFNDKFLRNSKTKINEIQNLIIDDLNCPSNECPVNYDRVNYIKNVFNKNNFKEELILDRDIYLAWQNRFKYYLRHFKLKIKDIEQIYVSV